MNEEGKTKLNIDWDEVFPGEELDIGGFKVSIPPLGLKKLSWVMGKLKSLGSELASAGITWENYNDENPATLLALTSTILEHCPEVISEASNIVLEDVERLPLDVQISIVEKVLFANTKSKDTLEKNLSSLGEMLADLMGPKTMAKKLETPSKS